MTAAEFRIAIDAYRLEGEPPPPLAGRSLIVGHAHGLRAEREPALIYAMAQALGAAVLAFEWSHDELGRILSLPFDVEALWALPPAAEPFCGDGRFTAGHVALLERLRPEVICVDQTDWEHPDRSELMAERLAEQWDGETPLLAIVGAAHLPAFARRLPGLAQLRLDYAGLATGNAVVPER
jgi:hypothetical protein